MKNLKSSEPAERSSSTHHQGSALMRKVSVDLQVALDASESLRSQIPPLQQFESWVTEVLEFNEHHEDAEVSIRIVDSAEMIELNQTYRHKSGSTNVLSFPFVSHDGVDIELLGDIVLCLPVIVQESKQQAKQCSDHWAHMIVHGILHLLGYDHISSAQAEQMEQMEQQILAKFKISNPYGETENL